MPLLEQAVTNDACGVVQQACASFARVERHVSAHEKSFGRDRLLEVVAGLDAHHIAEHTEYYRRVIRRHRWPNTPRPNRSASEFVAGFERSLIVYAGAGFRALSYLASAGGAGLSEVHRWIGAAEAVRGQFGKQSPDGLDACLDRAMDTLSNFVRDEHELVLLGSLTGTLRSVEAALPVEFEELRKFFPQAPVMEEVNSATGSAKRTIWNFLRRHARWSLEGLHQQYRDFATGWDSSGGSEHVRASAIADRKRLYSGLPEPARNLADEIVALNYLNLRVEPSFGFKGCVGLPIGMVFRAVELSGADPVPSEAQLVADKWALFNNANSVGE